MIGVYGGGISRVGGKIVIKPRTQLAISSYVKGAVIDAAVTDGRVEYERLRAPGAHDQSFARAYPEVMFPLLQRYCPEATDAVLSVSGFRDITGAHVVMRGANKVLQRSNQLGVGLCFEDAEVAPDLAGQVKRLCERIGYYGAFELEFIVSEGSPLLIDFNGRFYNQLAFDVARGLDLPCLVYAGATGNTDDVRRLTSAVPGTDEKGRSAFCNSFGMSATFRLQRALGRVSMQDVQRWQQWFTSYHGRVVDPVRDKGDPLPVLIDRVKRSWSAVRHPRGFIWSTLLGNGVGEKQR